MTNSYQIAGRTKLGAMAELGILLVGSVFAIACSSDSDVALNAGNQQEHDQISSVELLDWRIVHSYDYDWDGDGKPEHFRLENNENDWNARLIVTSHDNTQNVIDLRGGWERHDVDYLYVDRTGLTNLSDSPYLMFVRRGTDTQIAPLLFLFGYAYASSPGRLSVLWLDDGVPAKIFDMENFDLLQFGDVDGDDNQDLVGMPCSSEGYGRNLSTYCPTHVYFLPSGGSPAEFSLRHSEQQTTARLNGWAGPQYSEKIAVVWTPDYGGTPKVMSREEADKLFEENQPEP